MDVEFIPQYKFSDCAGKRNIRLPFDFAVLDNNGELSYLIEYDGEGHFHESSFGKASHKRTVTNDKIKNDYCNKNGIKLYRISYKEKDNLKEIVQKIIESNMI